MTPINVSSFSSAAMFSAWYSSNFRFKVVKTIVHFLTQRSKFLIHPGLHALQPNENFLNQSYHSVHTFPKLNLVYHGRLTSGITLSIVNVRSCINPILAFAVEL